MSQSELFAGGSNPASTASALRPLADRMRPREIAQFVGQSHLLAEGRPLRRAIEGGRVHSMVFWGPPGTGKTTLGRLVAAHANAQFIAVSAVLSGVKDIRAAIDRAREHRAASSGDTVLFVDEVHRFNKGQQDAFLPYVEDGTVIFVGATTENPSFALNNALLSRARVYVLKALEREDLNGILSAALADDERGLGERGIAADAALLDRLAAPADGDARRGLNLLELAAELAHADGHPARIDEVDVQRVLEGSSVRRFDKGGDVFYDQISALHKSIRGTNPDGALYWLARMLDGGCDPLYVARRLVRVASEDVGIADPRALALALDAWETYERLGSPEGELAIAEAAAYLACAPKSNALYAAFNEAMADAREQGSLEVPMHLRNAPTRLMSDLGHGRDYRYAHDESDAYAAGERYLPDALQQRRYYRPSDRGLEGRIAEKLDRLRALDEAARGGRTDDRTDGEDEG